MSQNRKFLECNRRNMPEFHRYSLEASVTIMADFSQEFNPPVRWRSKHQTKNDC